MTLPAGVLVRGNATLREALEALTKSGKQIVLVVGDDARLVGVATDGDLRKAILKGVTLDAPITAAMNPSPVVAAPGMTRAETLAFMHARSIRHLPLVDGAHRVVDLLRLDELLAAPVLPARAVIMAGGEGRRLRPLTDATPKPLLRIGGKPLLELLVERLRESGIEDVLIAVHHKSDLVQQQIGDGARLGVRVDYVAEPTPLGTMGALTLVRERLEAPFFVVNGDILTRCDFRAMWEFHRAQAGAAMTVGTSLYQVDIPYGELSLAGARVTAIEEKPRREIPVNAGIYVLEPSALDVIPTGRYADATDVIRRLLEQGRTVAGYLIREYWLDVGRHPDLEKANRDVAEGRLDGP
jgi:dTDP-glucose pyrophosphorylase